MAKKKASSSKKATKKKATAPEPPEEKKVEEAPKASVVIEASDSTPRTVYLSALRRSLDRHRAENDPDRSYRPDEHDTNSATNTDEA